MLISARRNTIEEIEKINARTKKLPNYYSNVYPPYMYYLPLTPLANLNAHWRLSGIEKLKVIDTKFESTSLVVAYGKDVFVTRIQPDQTFDLLHEDFNSTLLVLACIAITVGFLIIKILVFVLRKISRSSEAKKRYLGA